MTEKVKIDFAAALLKAKEIAAKLTSETINKTGF